MLNSNVLYEYKEVLHVELKNYITNNPSLHKYFKEDWGKLKAKQYLKVFIQLFAKNLFQQFQRGIYEEKK